MSSGVIVEAQVALVVRNPPASAGDTRDLGLIPGLGRSPGVGNGNPFQYACLENSMDRGAWRTTVHGAAESQTRLSTAVAPDSSSSNHRSSRLGHIVPQQRRPWQVHGPGHYQEVTESSHPGSLLNLREKKIGLPHAQKRNLCLLKLQWLLLFMEENAAPSTLCLPAGCGQDTSH